MFTIIGAGLGIVIVAFIKNFDFMYGLDSKITLAISILIILLFALIFFIFSPKALKLIESLLDKWEDELKDRSFSEIAVGSVGLIIGLVIAFLLSQPVYKIPVPYVGFAISIILYGMVGYLGVKIALRNRKDVALKVKEIAGSVKAPSKEKVKAQKFKGVPKILDTSVIIDGRVKDICKSGFLEGPLVVPVFVLEELQHIADSSDGLKRNRGRRGLDIIKDMQDDDALEIIIFQGKYDDIKEVDSKLLQLTKDLNGKIVTNDYNLNKVAAVQDISVLNINELANSVKPVYLPGEEMQIQIVKLGKEHGQGLGYLDDGTMIVVEAGKPYLGETIDVVVTSVLQTSAGKMIFAKPC
ncbi:PIN/TRAM domain-containing protein [Peptoniphilus sp. oral taxon 386]|uniref:PIN/TRAM domain-containing protein n=1 Tax=Peptoniphilus sp. oral taxon 386 TaxID=652713 RepID=UPI0001DA9CBF|nr:PIN domain-containing protein [Peptoniphilus sp. oral taxon 386]EFI42658.1 PIN domain protein [Peptoniphilus sp. oral taxon 386 str. F0131]